jgi:hypothetical protein
MLDPEARKYAALPGGHNEAWPDAFKNTLGSIFDFIQSGQPMTAVENIQFPTFASAMRTMQIVDAMLQSANSGGNWTKVAAA